MAAIKLIEQEMAHEVFAFVCREFVQGSELHRAAGVELAEYTDYFRDSFISMVAEGHSLVAVDESSNSILGCLLAGRFQPCTLNSDGTPESILPIKAILVALEDKCLPRLSRPLEETVLVDIAMVTAAANGKGHYTALRRALHHRAEGLGFTSVVGELSSIASQKVCVERLGQRLVGQVDYGTFQFNGGYPFSSIDNTDSIQLVEHLLK